ncbi:hypothetical protein GS454_04620 [Rhodococcus hoagii]|nr:hypothetical protein [Prescottella equi]
MNERVARRLLELDLARNEAKALERDLKVMWRLAALSLLAVVGGVWLSVCVHGAMSLIAIGASLSLVVTVVLTFVIADEGRKARKDQLKAQFEYDVAVMATSK